MENLKSLFQYYWLLAQFIFWKIFTPILIKIPNKKVQGFCLGRLAIIGFKFLELALKKSAYNKRHLSA